MVGGKKVGLFWVIFWLGLIVMVGFWVMFVLNILDFMCFVYL